MLHVQELELIWHVTTDCGKKIKIQTLQAVSFKYLILLILKNSYRIYLIVITQLEPAEMMMFIIGNGVQAK